MPPQTHTGTFGQYGFRFSDKTPGERYHIASIGWQEERSTAYSWNGLMRKDGGCLLQITLAGSGEIRLGADTRRLNAGDAFLVTIPGDHHYYLPEDSRQWEFLYVILYGQGVLTFWEDLQRKLGSVVRLPAESAPVQSVWEMFRLAERQKITDGYQASALVYRLLMELYRLTLPGEAPGDVWPESVAAAVSYIRQHYMEPAGLPEIAAAAGLSKYYFARQFHRCTGMTPVQYVTKIRIQKAVELLRTSELSVESIAQAVGYANGNYFGKWFRRIVGSSPGEFRRGREVSTFDHLTIE
ncbi:MAG: helix-turn-helix transcriptional regulator [Paenibacillaceae bacterium]|nr:helix-turn-helix transcriptional regulator [Paenibacillaceae bacterium]